MLQSGHLVRGFACLACPAVTLCWQRAPCKLPSTCCNSDETWSSGGVPLNHLSACRPACIFRPLHAGKDKPIQNSHSVILADG